MTYAANETSVDSGRPVEIYEITAGATPFFYTSAEDDVNPSGVQNYIAIAGLKRTDTEDGPEKREGDFQIELPTTDALAQIFTGVMPGFRVRMKVRRFHRDDTPTPEVVQIFDGYIQSASFTKNLKQTILTARPVIASIGKQIPRRTYMSSCNHVLYEPLTCRVDDTDPAFRASVLEVAGQVGNVMTVVSGLLGVYADGFMDAGFVEVVGGADFRLILEHVGNSVTLLVPFSVTPASVNVFAGCAHVISVCEAKFDNTIQFGGFAFVPTRNPFQTGIV